MLNDGALTAGKYGKLQRFYDVAEMLRFRLSTVNRGLISFVAIIVFLLIWEVLGRNINPIFASYPTAIFAAGVEMMREGALEVAFLQSMQPLTIGFLMCAVFGVPIGLVLGRSPVAEAAFGIFVTAGYATPLVALVPLYVLWFGLGFAVKVAIVFTLGVFPVIINTWQGVKNVPRTLVEVGIAFVATRRMILREIIVPATLPYIMTGLRLCVGRCIIGMVVAEFFTSVTGLGGVILQAGDSFDTAQLFVPVIILMALGVVLTWFVGWLEHKVAPWQHEIAGGEG
jgi:NitT/TauT family transport system permease protein